MKKERPANCECDNTHEQNKTCCRPCWDAGFRRVASGPSLNTTPHLNRSKVKQTALEIAALIRPANKFNRVGMSFVERIEAKGKAAIREEIRIHPSVGKTIK